MANKTTTVTFRMNPSVKGVLRAAADKERRSVANMIEVMVVDYGKKLGIMEEGIRETPRSKLGTRGRK
jgi:hypothetical protein